MSQPNKNGNKTLKSGLDSIELDDGGLEIEEDDTPEIEVPFDPTKIDIIVKTMTIGSLENRLENHELDLTPDFQRHDNVWNSKRKSRLIESILLRIPLPSFYFSEGADGSYAVVDGLQRLCAIFHFIQPALLSEATGAKLNPLELSELQYLKELNGKLYSELDRKFQRRISELEITANIIRANTPPAVKFNVFARLNQGGMPLNAQEIRNAIFPGQWRQHLRKMAEGQAFRSATEEKIRTERQQDIELALRFVSLWQLGKPFIRPANQTLDEFLNSVVEQELTHWTEEKWTEVEAAFEYSIRAAQSIFGRHVFRKSSGDQRRRPINRGLFEAQLLVSGIVKPENLLVLQENKSLVAALFNKALDQNDTFGQSMSYGTGSSGASNTRIEGIAKIFKEALDVAGTGN